MAKTKKQTSDKPEDMPEHQRVRWNHCACSGEPLRPPLVFDDLGNIFNKEELMKQLLEKTLDSIKFGHIRRLKDVYPLSIKSNPDFVENEKTITDHTVGRFICPISGALTTGFATFFALKSCGHAYAKKADEVLNGACSECGKPFDSSKDAIILNGNDIQVAELRQKMEAARALEPEKSKKKRKVAAATTGAAAMDGSVAKKASVVENDKVTLSTAVAASIAESAHHKSKMANPIYASIFKDKAKEALFKETFCCRALNNIMG